MLLVCDSHPVQYRAPIYRELAGRIPGGLFVVYASDCSIRGHKDAGFGLSFAWDDPMMEGYECAVLNSERGEPLSGWGSLTGQGLRAALKSKRPRAVLLTGLNFRFDMAALAYALTNRSEVWLRCETQDEAAPKRSVMKEAARFLLYRGFYRGIDRFFYIGELNRQHYLRHGVASARLTPARYFTVDRVAKLGLAEKESLRSSARKSAAVDDDAIVCGFSGKLIPKKNPALLFTMLDHLPDNIRSKVHLYFVGSGELETELRTLADGALRQHGVRTHFAGFSNQSGIASHYLAIDILVLPSRREGETWGLVANEAMQAGCGVVVSSAVGCGADFQSWERFRIFEEGDASELARAVTSLSGSPRNFSWASQQLAADYSLEATVAAFETEFRSLQV